MKKQENVTQKEEKKRSFKLKPGESDVGIGRQGSQSTYYQYFQEFKR